MTVLEKTETRQRIVLAAHELFNKYGIRSITMDDIAKHLSISKKTIYQFFKEKDEIVHSCCVDEMENHQCMFDEIKHSSKDAIHECLEMMKYLSEIFGNKNPNMFYDLQKFYSGSWKVFRAFKEQKIMNVVEENLKKGIREGLYRADINIKILARLRMEEVEMAMNPDIFPASKFSIRDVQLALLDHFLHGITTLKGHKLINKYKQIKEEE